MNAGGDTDTISSMLGAVLGGYHGVEAMDQETNHRIQNANSFLELENTVETFTDFLLKGEIRL